MYDIAATSEKISERKQTLFGILDNLAVNTNLTEDAYQNLGHLVMSLPRTPETVNIVQHLKDNTRIPYTIRGELNIYLTDNGLDAAVDVIGRGLVDGVGAAIDGVGAAIGGAVDFLGGLFGSDSDSEELPYQQQALRARRERETRNVGRGPRN